MNGEAEGEYLDGWGAGEVHESIMLEYGVITAEEQRSVEHVTHGQPDDGSYDKILKELAFHRMIEHGLADSKQSRTISNKCLFLYLLNWTACIH